VIISVTGRHFEIRDDVKTYIVKKLEGFSKYSSKIIEARAIVEFSKGIHRVELLVAGNHLKYFGDSDDPDIRSAIDKAMKKMDSQLRNHKEKIKRKHKKVRRVPAPVEEMADEIDEIIDEDYLE
jgi:putative sigma-54 modulation protein